MLEINTKAELYMHRKVITFCFLMYYWCEYKNLYKLDFVVINRPESIKNKPLFAFHLVDK